jgi:hypothetical protein
VSSHHSPVPRRPARRDTKPPHSYAPSAARLPWASPEGQLIRGLPWLKGPGGHTSR